MYRGFLGSAPPQQLVASPAPPMQESATVPRFQGAPQSAPNGVSSHMPYSESASMLQTSDDVRTLIRREVNQAFAASVPTTAYSSAPSAPPIQLILQNNSTVHAEQQVQSAPPVSTEPQRPLPKSIWELSRQDVADFWASPLNRICVFGVAGLLFYLYQGHSHHRWRMSELQRRIDNNIFLRTMNQLFGAAQNALK
mmetsp:Transcript_15397/g.26945  ORF Transcript_15397/g.26945 Transcript_15397/m.26945 type:complete len:196 (+) Transcript_15397:79-666(+)